MANSRHLAILRRGLEAWNSWRLRNRDPANPDQVNPDLFRATLAKADLSGADLSDVDLAEANLTGANLSNADLSGAVLDKAKLHNANLSNANLSNADGDEADLTRTNLSNADLSGALLKMVKLQGAELRGAKFGGVDLSGIRLSKLELPGADLQGVNLSGAKLPEARLLRADLFAAILHRADLSGAELRRANLVEADLSRAKLRRANLTGANLTRANLSGADLTDANLEYCALAEANLSGATLTNCRIYAISAWDLKLSEKTEQQNLIISPRGTGTSVAVDDLEVAQFIYLLIDNRKVRNVIQTMTSKAVLILGNFAPERKQVLEAIKDRLRYHNYLPILFDFEGPDSQDIVETVATLARLARFVIADLTHPRSVPQELGIIIPDVEVPIVPLIEGSERPVATFNALRRSHKHRVLELRRYRNSHELLANFDKAVLVPANARFVELENARKQEPQELWVQADDDQP